MSKKRKFDDGGVLWEPIRQDWQRLLESSEKADILILVKSETGDDIMLKVNLEITCLDITMNLSSKQ